MPSPGPMPEPNHLLAMRQQRRNAVGHKAPVGQRANFKREIPYLRTRADAVKAARGIIIQWRCLWGSK
jgi:hypothetical protein